MLKAGPYTIVTGGALGVDLEAEKLTRNHGMAVEVYVPPCHPRSKLIPPVSHEALREAIPLTNQAAFRLNRNLQRPISMQYIHRNYHVVKNASMVLAFGSFQTGTKLIHGGTGWGVEFAKLLKKSLYVYDVDRNIWMWFDNSQEQFSPCEQMTEEQIMNPTLMSRTAIIGERNIYDYPDALLELNELFKRSLNINDYPDALLELNKLFKRSLNIKF